MHATWNWKETCIRILGLVVYYLKNNYNKNLFGGSENDYDIL